MMFLWRFIRDGICLIQRMKLKSIGFSLVINDFFKKVIKNISGVLFAFGLLACSSKDTAVDKVEPSSIDSIARAYIVGVGGIHLIELNMNSGALVSKGLVAKLDKPKFLTVHPFSNFLYVAGMQGEHKTGAIGIVTSFLVDSKTGGLTKLNEVDSGGRNAVHIELNNAGDMAIAANFHGSSVSTFLVNNDGSLTDVADQKTYTGSGSDHPLQREPHPHSSRFSADGQFAYVQDLGTDSIYIYQVDASSAALTPAVQPRIKLPPVSGTRHFDFHPSSPFAYVINELSADITIFKRNKVTGGLIRRQVISTLPEEYDGRKWAAEVLSHPDGKFVYASNRTHDSIAVFEADPDSGLLTLVGFEPTRGKTPRHFAIDPTGKWMLVGNQESNTMAVFEIDQETGELDPVGEPLQLDGPRAVAFLSINAKSQD